MHNHQEIMEMQNCQPLSSAQQPGRRVLVTGASGLLGRQVLKELNRHGWDTRGLCSTRCREGLVKCDLTKPAEIQLQIAEFKPDVVIHLAAERRPDVVHKKEEQARSLNCDATSAIAKACQDSSAWLIYISTDYVFDGTQPPYAVTMRPNPLSEYGVQKLEGERIVLEVQNSSVLRIPLLYGPVEYLKESAVTALYSDLQQGLHKADHGQKRYPTYTCDVARVIGKMLDVRYAGKPLRGIFHWQGDECLTKYDMVQAISKVMGIDASGVVADLASPRFPRPEDSRLDCSRLALELNIEPSEFQTPFREALMASMKEAPTCAQRNPQEGVAPSMKDSPACAQHAPQGFAPSMKESPACAQHPPQGVAPSMKDTPTCSQCSPPGISPNQSPGPPETEDSSQLQSAVKRRCIGADETVLICALWTTMYKQYKLSQTLQ